MQKKDLYKYYWLKKEVNDLKERIEEFGDGIKSSQISDVSVSGSHTNKSIQEKKLELISLYMDKRLTALEKYVEIERYISSIENDDIRLILRYRHLDLMTWNEIADKLSDEEKIFSEDAIKKRYKRFFDKKKES